MKRRFSLYVRQHQSGWYTAQVLALPRYAAYGPSLSELREEIAEALAADLRRGELRLDQPTCFDDLVRKSITVEVKAVQHHRLVTVPLRMTVLFRPVEPGSKIFEVRVPRADVRFTIRGEENILPWAEEQIRGAFHMSSVKDLLAHQYEKSERLDEVDVVYQPQKAKRRVERDVKRVIEQTHPLDAMGVELVREAEQGRLPRAMFRDVLVEQLEGLLDARVASSALLVGPSGAGKTALVHELAHRVALERALPDTTIWHIPPSRIIAGARYLGQWQERCAFVVQQIVGSRGVWYAESLLELLQAGAGRDGLDVASFLLPHIRAGELSLIVEATPDALAVAERAHPAFVRALSRLRVPTLELSRSYEVLERAAERLGKAHAVTWGEGAVRAALDVVARFGDAESLPGSGLGVLERMVGVAGGQGGAITEDDAIAAFSRISGFPASLVDPKALLDVQGVRRFFRARVIGQDPATDLLSNLVMLLKAGLNDPDKPLGSFLFMGPTGVGKTESALTLAKYLFGDTKRLVRFDMSEYGYPGSSIRLVDGPDGEGELTRPVREQPFSVLLFDEVEKADPSVYDVLLQVLGEGRLTDGTGRTVRFVHTIVIMTSNLGATKKDPIGFSGTNRPAAQHYLEAAERFFRPELVNRIDHVVPFSALERGSLAKIARGLLDAALAREGLTRRGLTVEYDEAVLERVLAAGFDPRYGARPMKRAVESEVSVPLARYLVEHPPPAGARVRLSVRQEGLQIEVGGSAAPPRLGG